MCTKEAEYGRTLHFNAPDLGPLQGNSADSGDVSREFSDILWYWKAFFPHILRHQPTPFPLFPLGALGDGGVLSIKVRSRHHNITTGA